MYYSINSQSLTGLNAIPVMVETDISDGLPVMDMVGYLSSEVKEARERVRTALKNSGYSIPPRRITINISPAGIRKSGTSFDLPIALSMLVCMGLIPEKALNNFCVIGELGLDGSIQPVSGVLPMVISARQQGLGNVLVPVSNTSEAGIVDGINIYGITSLTEACAFLNDELDIAPTKINLKDFLTDSKEALPDFSDLNGQPLLRRALEISASGNHNILIIGSPGAGKTMAAKRLPSIMPPLSVEESLELTQIYSIAGKLPSSGIISNRPFVSPHHTATPQALIGGGTTPKPGAVSLAHNAILFLDELPEFKKEVLEVLRQPIEDKVVNIARANASLTYPAHFLLAAAMNPCRCGYYPDRTRCSCQPGDIKRYLSRISGPMLDRIDLCVQAGELSYEQISKGELNESSAVIRERVLMARERQHIRLSPLGISTNSQMTPQQVMMYCRLGATEERLLKKAFEGLKLSARSYHRILKVARTIADLQGSEKIKEPHLYEALSYRMLDNNYFNGLA